MTHPRKIPVISQIIVLISNLTQQIGLGIMLMGMIFFFNALSNSTSSFRDKDWTSIPGVVDKSEKTDYYQINKPIYTIYYTFSYKDTTYEGGAHKIGSPMKVGEKISVLVNPNDPKQNLAKGLHETCATNGTLTILLFFPIPGILLVVYKIPTQKKIKKLLLEGTFAPRKISSKTPTDRWRRINNGPKHTFYKYTFEYEHLGKTYTTHYTTYKTWLIEDNPLNPVLFDSNTPEKAMIYDTTVFPTIDQRGNFVVNEKNLRYLLLPAICIGLLFVILFKIML